MRISRGSQLNFLGRGLARLSSPPPLPSWPPGACSPLAPLQSNPSFPSSRACHIKMHFIKSKQVGDRPAPAPVLCPVQRLAVEGAVPATPFLQYNGVIRNHDKKKWGETLPWRSQRTLTLPTALQSATQSRTLITLSSEKTDEGLEINPEAKK